MGKWRETILEQTRKQQGWSITGLHSLLQGRKSKVGREAAGSSTSWVTSMESMPVAGQREQGPSEASSFLCSLTCRSGRRGRQRASCQDFLPE